MISSNSQWRFDSDKRQEINVFFRKTGHRIGYVNETSLFKGLPCMQHKGTIYDVTIHLGYRLSLSVSWPVCPQSTCLGFFVLKLLLRVT